MRPESSLETLKGVGKLTAEKFAAQGVSTVQDLLYFFPRRYNDFSDIMPINSLRPGKVTVQGILESVVGRRIRRSLHVTEAVISQQDAKLRAIWYNQPYRAAQLVKGQEYFFAGEYGLQRNRYVLSNPATEPVGRANVSTARIVPVYPETSTLKSSQIRKITSYLTPLMQMWPETLPPEITAQFKLLPISQALSQLHFPDNTKKLEQAKKRVAFEELLWLVLASRLNKQDNAKLKGWPAEFNAVSAKHFTSALPFKLTNAQRRAAWEILQDIAKVTPMNRLLQGDVGSGKTVVAAMAMFMAAKSGLQSALLAPTEILAAQHANTLAAILEPLEVKVGLLTGSVPKKSKEVLKEKLAAGGLDIVVGTHALLRPAYDFHRLGLVVVDEQHRFGVRQRAELLTKGSRMPHLLSMTATPIPRSLQLTVYGELDVSIISQPPKGRQPILTKVVNPFERHVVYKKIEEEIKQGRQAYVICPVISAGQDAELKSVNQEYQKLDKATFKKYKIGLLHGQLKAPEKDSVMKAFASGETHILVSTTVVEVGVDVPNATIMLIEGAERFGLAQLHQLRGRVGRGTWQSYCFLVPSTVESISQRLRELENSNDGFYLAEADLKLRGPGEIYGRAQHGQLDLSFVNLADTKLLKNAQDAAAWFIKSGQNLLQYKQLHQKVSQYRRLTSLN